ncbi:MAG: DUF488 domain-containing protein [Chloroflexi bacterium]|nr:DUF488 domain-containing protein [Chloroflexota bacterium]MYD49226.1 DUF488 domain-containing protein [Chloroflexota bacterium]
MLTVGHSNHEADAFLQLLVRHGVDEVVDVRSAPYSRYASQFNHDALRSALEDVGIGYTYLGGELGGRPADRSSYDADGRVRYNRVADSDDFDDGIRRVIRAADEGQVALVCTEKEPLECHRTLLVARNLVERGVAVGHILADGGLEAHDATMLRLVEVHKLPPDGDMFRTRDDVIAEALERQVRKFAYVGERPPPAGDDWHGAL